jgi:hypothetical protein
MSVSESTAPTPSGTYPLDNLTFDLVALVYEKSKGLEAIDRYLEDATSPASQEIHDVLQEIRQQQVEQVKKLQACLEQRLRGYNPALLGEPWSYAAESHKERR